MAQLKFECPICHEFLVVNIRDAQVRYSLRNPVPIVVTHGDPEHAITLFVDKEYRLRAISGSNIVERAEEAKAARKPLTRRFVPVPMKGQVDLDDLNSFQIQVLALVDGKRSVDELAQVLGVATMRVKILCEQLVRLGKIESVQVVIE